MTRTLSILTAIFMFGTAYFGLTPGKLWGHRGIQAILEPTVQQEFQDTQAILEPAAIQVQVFLDTLDLAEFLVIAA